jgi:hypothetical protein
MGNRLALLLYVYYPVYLATILEALPRPLI